MEHALALLCYELRKLLGNPWRPRYAQFRHASPAMLAPLRQVFGEKLFFNQDINAIRLSKEDCEHPLRGNAYSNRKSLERAAQNSVIHGRPFVLRVDRIIRLLINAEECTATQTANALNMKLRTLQYQLQQHQTSYQLLYDSARLDLARQHLTHSDQSAQSQLNGSSPRQSVRQPLWPSR
jgi:hypothetical protein